MIEWRPEKPHASEMCDSQAHIAQQIEHINVNQDLLADIGVY